MTVLIVDDATAMRQSIRNFIGDLVVDFYECSDGSEALACYIAHRPDWVLMDLKMKELDGLAATRQIIESFPEARIIIVTSYDDPLLREASGKAGAREYVSKSDLLSLRGILQATTLSNGQVA